MNKQSVLNLSDLPFPNYRATYVNKQSEPMNGLCVSQLCSLTSRVEVKEEKDTKVVPCK